MLREEGRVVVQADRVDKAVLDALGEQAEPVLDRVELVPKAELIVAHVDVGAQHEHHKGVVVVMLGGA